MTLILMVATCAVLTFLGLSCRRARLDLEEQLCECLDTPAAAAVGFGCQSVETLSAGPMLTGIDGGRAAACASGGRARSRHLRAVSAG